MAFAWLNRALDEMREANEKRSLLAREHAEQKAIEVEARATAAGKEAIARKALADANVAKREANLIDREDAAVLGPRMERVREAERTGRATARVTGVVDRLRVGSKSMADGLGIAGESFNTAVRKTLSNAWQGITGVEKANSDGLAQMRDVKNADTERRRLEQVQKKRKENYS